MRTGWPVAFLCFLSLLALAIPAGAMSVKAGDTAPQFTARTMQGQEIRLSDYRGRDVFLVFWSSWCSRCKEEMVFLRQLRDRYPSVVFLAVNAEAEEPDERTLQHMEDAIQEWGIPFTILIDYGLRIWDLYGVNALPSSVIIGKDGSLIFVEPNFYFESPLHLEEALEAMESAASKAGAPSGEASP
ncbi:MAG: TlpA family protein disulfide reductase [bacterium]|nr:MAG: TlpA family protein disulfide reductase [bacterium]